ncbi:MAG: helix-turn-helix domain-containing protein [Xenococcaceae cyanobacterium]
MKQPQVGRLIRELRLQMRLTQEQFAAFLGVVYPTVNRWENGHAQPSPMAIKLIKAKLEEMGDRGQELLAKYQI